MTFSQEDGGKRPDILVVEDEVIIAADLAKGLETLGYRACGLASTGEEAAAMAIVQKPDLILMDIYLNGDMDGVEAARLIRRHQPVPVVFISGYADAELLDRTKSADPFGFILKPFNIYEIRAAVEIALHRAWLERSHRPGTNAQAPNIKNKRLSQVMTSRTTDEHLSVLTD